MKKKNKGFMLLETLIVSTFILGTLIFLYVQFSNVKKSYDKSFRYNTVPNLYLAKNMADLLTTDDYNTLDNKLAENATQGYFDITDCSYITSSICKELIIQSKISKILYTHDDLTVLKDYISKSGENDAVFDAEFKKYILQLQTSSVSGRNRLIIYFEDTTFASIVLDSAKVSTEEGETNA